MLFGAGCERFGMNFTNKQNHTHSAVFGSEIFKRFQHLIVNFRTMHFGFGPTIIMRECNPWNEANSNVIKSKQFGSINLLTPFDITEKNNTIFKHSLTICCAPENIFVISKHHTWHALLATLMMITIIVIKWRYIWHIARLARRHTSLHR